MKAGWTLHLARWIGGLSIALFVSSVANAATFNFDSTGLISPQTTGTQNIAGGNDGILASSSLNLAGGLAGTWDITIAFTNLGDGDSGDISNTGFTLNDTNRADATSSLVLNGLVDGTYSPIFLFGTTDLTNAANFHYTLTATADFTPEVNQVPIPAAALLFASGLGFLGFSGRKKKVAPSA